MVEVVVMLGATVTYKVRTRGNKAHALASLEDDLQVDGCTELYI
jgi:hypothetical protein